MLKAEDIVNANEVLAKVDVGHGKKYVMVNERIKAFRQILPNGSIDTQILGMENGIVTIQAKIYDDNDHLLASGLAQEKEQSSYINKTSYVENCETSAIGRALGVLGIGVDESMASAEEVANAIKNQDGEPKKSASTSNSNASTSNSNASTAKQDKSTIDPEAKKWQDKISEYAESHGMTTTEVCKDYDIGIHSTAQRLEEVYNDLTLEPDYAALPPDDDGPFK